jgi:hypothetical protein
MSVMVRVKLYLCLTKHRVVKTYWGVEVDFHALLTSTQDVDKWSASRHGRFTSGNRTSRYPLGRRLGGPQSRSGREGKEKEYHHCNCRELKPCRPGRSLVTIPTKLRRPQINVTNLFKKRWTEYQQQTERHRMHTRVKIFDSATESQ